MPSTTNRGRGNTARSKYGTSGTGSAWGRYFGSYGATGTSNPRTNRRTGATHASGRYTNLRNTFEQKIASFRTLCTQTQGAGNPKPTPATLNTFANWINKGAVVHNVSATQIAKWTHANRTNFNTATNAKNALWKRFGKTAIKAVSIGKGNNFIVACAPTVNGKPFKFPR